MDIAALYLILGFAITNVLVIKASAAFNHREKSINSRDRENMWQFNVFTKYIKCIDKHHCICYRIICLINNLDKYNASIIWLAKSCSQVSAHSSGITIEVLTKTKLNCSMKTNLLPFGVEQFFVCFTPCSFLVSDNIMSISLAKKMVYSFSRSLLMLGGIVGSVYLYKSYKPIKLD